MDESERAGKSGGLAGAGCSRLAPLPRIVSMRWTGAGIFVLLLAAALFWLRPDHASHASAHAPANGSGASATLSAPEPTASTSASSPARSARQTVQTAAALHVASSNAGNRPAAPSVPAARETTAAQAHAAQPTVPEAEPPKSAGELFVTFIANDPTQVFAPSTVTYHAAVQSEPVDPEWGPAAAAALRDFFNARFGDRFEIPYVDCRQNLCELQVAGRLGGDSQADMHDAQTAMNDMKRQPWWNELQIDQESGIVATSPDDRVLLLWFFSRK